MLYNDILLYQCNISGCSGSAYGAYAIMYRKGESLQVATGQGKSGKKLLGQGKGSFGLFWQMWGCELGRKKSMNFGSCLVKHHLK